MGGTFRPLSGLVFGLYIDGFLCAYEHVDMEWQMEQLPFLTARLAATYGITSQESFSIETENKINALEKERRSILSLIQLPDYETQENKEAIKDYKLNSSGYNFVKNSRKFYPTPTDAIFPDPLGSKQNIKYIGFEHLITKGEIFSSLSITEAEKLLKADLQRIESYIKSVVTKTALTQAQFNSLVSFIYDVGTDVFGKSLVYTALQQKNITQVTQEMRKFDKCRGKINTVLEVRRINEISLFKQDLLPNPVTDSALSDEQLLEATLKKRQELRDKAPQREERLIQIEKELTILRSEQKVTITKQVNWRNLTPNTKIHVLFRDKNWEETRFSVFFEGEMMSPGFNRGVESRDFYLQAHHISQVLEYTSLDVMEAGGVIQDKIEGTSQADGTVAAFSSTGSIITNFYPTHLAEKNGIFESSMDIYNFCKYSLNEFDSLITNSSVRNNYYARALKVYDLINRIHDPNFDINTFTTKESESVLKWTTLYTFILEYTFKNMIPQLGSRISYMQMMRYITEFFLHEIIIQPNTKTAFNTINVKPRSTFLPVPKCNLILPIHGAVYSFSESYRTKPTRHRMDMQPAYGQPDPSLTSYYRVISPKQLRDKINTAKNLSEDERAKMDIITDEEYERGIIPSYNDLPAVLTGLLELLVTTDKEGNIIPEARSVKGAGDKFSDSENNSTTIPKSFRETLSTEQIKAVSSKLFFHKKLLVLEGFAKKMEDLTNDKLSTLGNPIKSKNKFVPNRITVIPYESASAIKGPPPKATYTIVKGVVKRIVGRYYHLFEEAEGSVPMLLKIDGLNEAIQKLNKQEVFLIEGKDTSEGARLPLNYKKSDSVDETKHLNTISNYVVGGYHQSIVILLDESPESQKPFYRLMACLAEICEIKLDIKENNGNVRTLSDYFGEDYITFNRDKEIKSLIETCRGAQENLRNASISEYTAQLQSIEKGSIGSTKSGGRLEKVLEANEASGETKYKISHAIVQSSNYTFGGSQFDIGFRKDAWEYIGLTKQEVDRVEKIGIKVRKAGTRNVETVEDKQFLSVVENKIKLNKTKVDELDNKQRQSLISNAERQLRMLFPEPGIIFTSFSIFAHFVDISNQFGNNMIDNYKAEARKTLLNGNNEVTPETILKFRLASGRSDDQRRRNSNIERIYGYEKKLNLSLEQLIKGGSGGATIGGPVVSEPLPSIKSTGPVEGNSNSVTPAVGDTFEQAVVPSPTQAKIQDVYNFYAQPLCDYYFYENRYKSNQLSLNIAFHPYLHLGYPALIMDTSEMRKHLTGTVSRIRYSESASGSLLTSVGITYVRRSDELGVQRDLLLTAGQVLKEDGTYGDPVSVADTLKDNIPFLGGDYAEAKIDATYDKVLGCSRVIQEDLEDVGLQTPDIRAANDIVKRKMQYCKVVGASEALQTKFDDLYRENPSKIAIEWNNGEFPSRLYVIKNVKDVLNIKDKTTLLMPSDEGYQYIVDDKMFNSETQELVKKHNSIINFKRGLVG